MAFFTSSFSLGLLKAAVFVFVFISVSISALVEGGAGGRGSLTHLHFYMHDSLGGPNQTAFRVVKSPLNFTGMALNFGDVVVFDNPLTAAPNLTSELVGRAQGFYVPDSVSPDPTRFVLLLMANLVIGKGPYNGSTVAIMGRDAIFEPVREIPVIGGGGAFRMGRGYVLMSTTSIDTVNGNAVLEMNVYIKKD